MSATVDGLAAGRDSGPARAHGVAQLLPFIARKRLIFLLTVCTGIVAQLSTATSAATGAWLVGQAVQGGPPEQLIVGFWVLGGTVLVASLVKYLQTLTSHDFAFSLVEVLQVGVYDGLERAAPAYVMGRRTGELTSVATADADLMEWFYAHVVADYLSAVLVPLGALIVLYMIQPIMALVLLPFLPLIGSVPFWLARRAGEQGKALLVALGGLNAEVVEGVQGLRELTVFGAGRSFLAGLMRHSRTLHARQMRYGSRSGMELAAIDMLLALSVLATVTTGLVLVGQHGLSFSEYPLCIVLAGAALAPISEVTNTARKLGELRAGANRVVTVFHQQPHVDDRGTVSRAAVAEPSVTFERVGFAYSAERGAVLAEASFELNPGEMVALVGRSGAGKTTCANLLLRFWDVGSGTVRIGGRDLRDFAIADLRRLVAVVPQDVYLFRGSVADNIRLGRPDASDAEVERAARLAQAHDFIAALPRGYATPCGERGARLSGGQRQRIAIARAFLREAPILVLDEAVSNLDTENEAALQRALQDIRRQRTVLIVAHRPSTIRTADRIVVLEEGRIVEEGTHEALMARGGAYTRLIAADGAENALAV